MFEGHGKAFAFSQDEIGFVDPKIMEPMVIFTISSCTVEPEADSGTTGSYTENHRPTEGKDSNGDP